MKKYSILAAAICTSLLLGGCGNNTDSGTEISSQDNDVTVTETTEALTSETAETEAVTEPVTEPVTEAVTEPEVIKQVSDDSELDMYEEMLIYSDKYGNPFGEEAGEENSYVVTDINGDGLYEMIFLKINNMMSGEGYIAYPDKRVESIPYGPRYTLHLYSNGVIESQVFISGVGANASETHYGSEIISTVTGEQWQAEFDSDYNILWLTDKQTDTKYMGDKAKEIYSGILNGALELKYEKTAVEPDSIHVISTLPFDFEKLEVTEFNDKGEIDNIRRYSSFEDKSDLYSPYYPGVVGKVNAEDGYTVIRKGRDSSYRALCQLENGDSIAILGNYTENPEWIEVARSADGCSVKGFVLFSDLTDIVSTK